MERQPPPPDGALGTRPTTATRRAAAHGPGLDSAALLQRTREGCTDSYGELYARYRDYAMLVARRAGACDPADAAADAFTKTLSAIQSGLGPTVAFGPYIATASRSAAVNQLRRAGRDATVSDQWFDTIEAEGSVLELDPSLTGERDRLVAAFMSLTRRHQLVLHCTEVLHLSLQETAQALALPTPNAAAALKRRALTNLRVNYIRQVATVVCHVDMPAELVRIAEASSAGRQALREATREHRRACPDCDDRRGLALLAVPGWAGFGSIRRTVRRLRGHRALVSSLATGAFLLTATLAHAVHDVGPLVMTLDPANPAPTEPAATVAEAVGGRSSEPVESVPRSTTTMVAPHDPTPVADGQPRFTTPTTQSTTPTVALPTLPTTPQLASSPPVPTTSGAATVPAPRPDSPALPSPSAVASTAVPTTVHDQQAPSAPPTAPFPTLPCARVASVPWATCTSDRPGREPTPGGPAAHVHGHVSGT